MLILNNTIINLNNTNINDNNLINEIKKNLTFLYSTIEGTCPYDREFGISSEYMDYPPDVAMNFLSLEIIQKTEIYEDRVHISNINFDINDTNLTLKITIELKED